MTRLERCELAIEKGYTYNPDSGKVFNRFGREIKAHKEGYIQMAIYTKDNKYYLRGHQFAWFWVNKECVECLDHINGIKDDNRISNLRSVTYQENCYNYTNAKGYTWYKKYNKWLAQIKFDNKRKHLGYFDTEEDARAAYLEAKEKYHIIN
jgi:hypothetical protein